MTLSELFRSKLFRQFVGVFGLIYFLLGVIFYQLSISTLETAEKQQTKLVTDVIKVLISKNVQTAVLIEDYQRLHAFSQALVKDQNLGIESLTIYGEGDEKPLAMAKRKAAGNTQKFNSCKTVNIPIEIEGLKVGLVEACISNQQAAATIAQLKTQFTFYLLLGMVLLFLVTLWIANKLINRITYLSDLIKAYTPGAGVPEVNVVQKDELGRLENFALTMMNTVNSQTHELKRKAETHPLTGLFNKEKFIQDVQTFPTSFEVNVFMIDGLENLEQSFGYVIAKKTIRAYAEKVNETVGAKGALYHVEDNVFIVIDGAFSEDEIKALSGNVDLSEHSGLACIMARAVNFVCSLQQGRDAEKTIMRVTQYVKRHGGQEVLHLDEKKMHQVLRGYEIAETIVNGDTKGLSVYGQIIYPVDKLQCPHIELLVRYVTDNKQVLSPFFFLNQVAEIGGMEVLDFFMLDEACRLLKEGPDRLELFINITPPTLFSKKFQAWLESQETKKFANKLVFEVNEAFFMELEEEALQLFNKMHQAGFKLALDDFGSGYSSYEWLSKIPFSYIKIDRSLLLVEGDKADAVLASISSLAHGLEITTIDEGVETECQYDRVVNFGFNQVQGYLLDRPGPIEDKIKKIKASF